MCKSPSPDMNCLVVPKGFSRTLLHFLDTPGGQPSPTNPGAMREPLKMRERAPGLQTPLLLNDMAETQSRALHSREGQAPHPSPSPAVGVWLDFLIWAHARPWCAPLFEARLQVPRIERELLDVSNCLEVCAPLRRALAFVLSREIKPAFRQRRPRVGFRNFLCRPIPFVSQTPDHGPAAHFVAQLLWQSIWATMAEQCAQIRDLAGHGLAGDAARRRGATETSQ